MKSGIRRLNDSILLLVLLIAAGSAYFFIEKFRSRPADMEEVKSALGGLRHRLTSGNIIGCVSYSGRDETTDEVANVLVPAQVVPGVKRDTTLFVFKADATDSLMQATTEGRNTIWKERSEHYYFVLNNTGL